MKSINNFNPKTRSLIGIYKSFDQWFGAWRVNIQIEITLWSEHLNSAKRISRKERKKNQFGKTPAPIGQSEFKKIWKQNLVDPPKWIFAQFPQGTFVIFHLAILSGNSKSVPFLNPDKAQTKVSSSTDSPLKTWNS